MAKYLARRNLIIAIAAVVVLVLVAVIVVLNLPRASEPTPEATTAETPTAEEPKEDTAPYPIYDVSCEELLPAEFRTRLWGEPGTEVAPQDSILKIVGGLPIPYAETQAGANVCRWRMTPTDSSVGTGGDGVADLYLGLYPFNEANFSAWLNWYSRESTSQTANCVESLTDAICSLRGKVGPVAASFEIESLTQSTRTGATETIDARFAEIAKLLDGMKPRDPWARPADAAVVPACESLVDVSAINSLLAPADSIVLKQKTPVPSLIDVEGVSPIVTCTILYGAGEFATPLLTVHGLTGAAWALEDARSKPRRDGERTPLTVAGLAKDDLALIGCSEEDKACSVDLRISKTWVQFRINRFPDFYGPAAFASETRDAAAAIAAILAERMR